MQKKKFETFNDGVVDIYDLDEEGEKGEKIATMRFGNQVIGTERYFKAKATDVEITKLIRIPMISKVEVHQIAEINGKDFRIVQAQQIFDSHPKKTVLSLEKRSRR